MIKNSLPEIGAILFAVVFNEKPKKIKIHAYPDKHEVITAIITIDGSMPLAIPVDEISFLPDIPLSKKTIYALSKIEQIHCEQKTIPIKYFVEPLKAFEESGILARAGGNYIVYPICLK